MENTFENKKIDGITGQNESIENKQNLQIKYHLNGYDVFLVNRNIIVDHSNKDNPLKELIKEMANSPDLQVYKDGIRIIHGDFDKFRNELWNNKDQKDVSIDKNFEALVKALSQNIFTRVHQLEGIIATVQDNKNYDEWQDRFNHIKVIENIEQKTKEIDNLFIEIYNKI